MTNIPEFKDHPEPIGTGAFQKDKTVECDCCGKETDVYCTHPLYAKDEIETLCPSCIASGKAAKRLDGEFQDYENIEGISPDCDQPQSLKMSEEELGKPWQLTPDYVICEIKEDMLSEFPDLSQFPD